MAKKLLSINVRGKKDTWGFEFYGDPKLIDEWRADGLDVIEIANLIPAWVVDLGLTRPWNRLQSLLNFRNPWGN